MFQTAFIFSEFQNMMCNHWRHSLFSSKHLVRISSNPPAELFRKILPRVSNLPQVAHWKIWWFKNIYIAKYSLRFNISQLSFVFFSLDTWKISYLINLMIFMLIVIVKNYEQFFISSFLINMCPHHCSIINSTKIVFFFMEGYPNKFFYIFHFTFSTNFFCLMFEE